MSMGSYWEDKKIPLSEEQLQSLNIWLSMTAKEWCQCFENNLVEEYDIATYSFCIPPNKECVICKDTINNDHYHCSICTKLTQLG